MRQVYNPLTGKFDLVSDPETEGAVMEADYDAQSILQATDDNTPIPITIGEETVVGRLAGGNIKALSVAELQNLMNIDSNAMLWSLILGG